MKYDLINMRYTLMVENNKNITSYKLLLEADEFENEIIYYWEVYYILKIIISERNLLIHIKKFYLQILNLHENCFYFSNM